MLIWDNSRVESREILTQLQETIHVLYEVSGSDVTTQS